MSGETQKKPAQLSLTIAALGVVYGDLGTSPLYAFRESLQGVAPNILDILGVLSLIFWALIIVISVKYLIILFRADNEGEGGVLALLALIKRFAGEKTPILFVISILGAGLILGDGMLTPSISILSAVSGIKVIVPSLSHWVTVITCTILVLLFSCQFYGTAKIGFIFGPLILLWFVIIGALGLKQILHYPIVLEAISPYFALDFLYSNGWKGYTLLGGVFLVVTGAEALYADLGHFGKLPIQMSWFGVVLPGLLLNYFGQGALLLEHPEAIVDPFFLLAPKWFAIPLIIIATIATIIASQAIISATFSLTRQAILLGLYPHLPIIQTSQSQAGQVYIPQMNLILMLGTLILVITFKTSNALAHAYGIAVNLNMVLTSFLVLYLAIKKWRWHWALTTVIFSIIIVIDLAFLGANIEKIETGGWVPIAFASLCAFIMYTWRQGREYLRKTYYMKKEVFEKILKQFDYKSLHRLPHLTAIFITDIYDKSGGSFLHFLKLNRTLPEHILIVNYSVENVPHVPPIDRFNIHCLKKSVCELTLRYGFMDAVSIPNALETAHERGLLPFDVNVDRTTYFLEIPNVVASKQQKTLWFFWQEKLFAFLVRNYSANMNIEFYKLPFNRTIGMGTYYMI